MSTQPNKSGQPIATDAPLAPEAEEAVKESNDNDDNVSRVDDLRSISRLGGRSTVSPYDQESQVSSMSCLVCANEVCRECARRSTAIPPEPSVGAQTDLGLIYCSSEGVKPKDFTQEVRAAMDVEQFVRQADLLLDVDPSSVAELVDLMLSRVSSLQPVYLPPTNCLLHFHLAELQRPRI